jgi:hypothetical protein
MTHVPPLSVARTFLDSEYRRAIRRRCFLYQVSFLLFF